MTEFEMPTTLHIEHFIPSPASLKHQRPTLRRNNCVPPLEPEEVRKLRMDLKYVLNVEIKKLSISSESDEEHDGKSKLKKGRETFFELEPKTESQFNPAVIPLQFGSTELVSRPRRRNVSLNAKVNELLGWLRGPAKEEHSPEHSSEDPSLNLFVPPSEVDMLKVEANVKDGQAESSIAAESPGEGLLVPRPLPPTAHPHQISRAILNNTPIDGFLSASLPTSPPPQNVQSSIFKRCSKLTSTSTFWRDVMRPRRRSVLDLGTAINGELKTPRQQTADVETEVVETGDALQNEKTFGELAQDELGKALEETASTIQTLNAVYGSVENGGRNAIMDESKNTATSGPDAVCGSTRDSKFKRPKPTLTGSVCFDDTIRFDTDSYIESSGLESFEKLFDRLVNDMKSQKQIKRKTSIPFLKNASLRQTLRKKIRPRAKLDIHDVELDVVDSGQGL